MTFKFTKKEVLVGFGVIVFLGVIWAVWFYQKNLRGVWPAVLPAPSDLVDSLPSVTPNSSGVSAGSPLPSPDILLKLQDGFSVSLLAKDLSGARVLAFDSHGNLWVSRTSAGVVTLLMMKNGVVSDRQDVFKGLRRPHGLAFDPDDPSMLYIGEEHRISRVRVYSEGEIIQQTKDKLEKVIDLAPGGNHFTRTLGFGPDKRLYVSVGSSCDVCYETDWRRAKILAVNKDGIGLKEYAKGLRNSVFFRWRPGTQELWATEMGRDLLGDDLPPDEINIVREGQNYGWPICYGKNVHDDDFDFNTYIRNPCQEPFEQPSHIDLQAHSAPLGLVFVPGSFPSAGGWPADYRGDLLVAYHGSWNRNVPTGYKVVRIQLDQKGNLIGQPEDFITGFFPPGGKGTSAALGRPVDVLFGPDGHLYISDDKAGAIYHVAYTGLAR